MPGIERIELTQVSRLFGSTVALQGVSVTFERGTLTVVQGPNGAGKTTLLSVLGTILTPTTGRVQYGPGTGGTRWVRGQIGWVAHDSHCYRALSARENVCLAAELYGLDPGPAWERVSRRVGIHGFEDQAVSSLSRGQKQRVALARALVHEPSLLLLDEPLSGLDVQSVEQMHNILDEERERGAIVVVVSHRAELSQRLRGRQLFLSRGRLERVVAEPVG